MRRAAIGGVEGPVLHIPGLEHSFDQADKPLVVDLPVEQVDQDAVVDIVEEPDDIDVHQPFHTSPGVLDGLKGGVAGSATPEAMRARREHRLVYAFQ